MRRPVGGVIGTCVCVCVCVFQVPLLVPYLEYKFLTTVESLDDLGRSEDISVFVVRRSTPKPLISAVINMPLSENVITV